jgi:hypothetical protein
MLSNEEEHIAKAFMTIVGFIILILLIIALW